MICIFCLQEKPPSDEHVFPDSIGGSLRIKEVCRECNSELSRLVDTPFAKCPVIQFARAHHSIEGKRGEIPFPLGEVGTFPDGQRVSLNREFEPHVKRGFEISTLSPGNLKVQFTADAKDRDKLEAMLGKPLRKAIMAEFPDWPDEKVDEAVGKAIAAAKAKPATPIPEAIHQRITVNPDDLLFEFLKIAYETWFRVFGYPWVRRSATAERLRRAILTRDAAGIRGEFGSEEIPGVGPGDRYHYLVQIRGNAHIRIFTVTCCVECEASDSAFQVPVGDANVVRLDFKEGKFLETSVAELLKRERSAEQSLNGSEVE